MPKESKVIRETIVFQGHPFITATHRTTLEVTRDEAVTKRATCIIGVGADKACADLNERFKQALRKADSKVEVKIIVSNMSFTASAHGHPSLTLTDERDMVLRRSSYICPRTLAVNSDKAASDIPREMMKRLADHSEKGLMVITVRI